MSFFEVTRGQRGGLSRLFYSATPPVEKMVYRAGLELLTNGISEFRFSADRLQ